MVFVAACFSLVEGGIAQSGREEAMDEQKQKSRARGYLGISTAPVPEAVRAQIVLEERFGLSVEFVVPGGPVDEAGIRRYDILISFGDQLLATSAQLGALVASRSPGEEVVLKALRKGAMLTFPAVLGDRREAPVMDPIASDLPVSDLMAKLLGEFTPKLSLEQTEDGSWQLLLDQHREIEQLLEVLRFGSGERAGVRFQRKWAELQTSKYEIWISEGQNGSRIVVKDRRSGVEIYEGSIESGSKEPALPEGVKALLEGAEEILREDKKGNIQKKSGEQ